MVLPTPLRIVADTNLFIAARWNPNSTSAWILEACRHQFFQICYSSPVKAEVLFLLKQVKRDLRFLRWVEDIFRHGYLVKLKAVPSVVREDPEDDKFLATAVEGQAHYLITSDEHLLRLGEFAGVLIVTPKFFAQRVSLPTPERFPSRAVPWESSGPRSPHTCKRRRGPSLGLPRDKAPRRGPIPVR
jgi:putative PIN family toxin of toxin-antitoxin system